MVPRGIFAAMKDVPTKLSREGFVEGTVLWYSKRLVAMRDAPIK